jgi:hypothetical protein
MENETLIVKAEQNIEQKIEQKEDLDVLKKKILKFLKVYFPQSLFWVEVKDESFINQNGVSIHYIVKIRTSLIKTTEKTKKTILYLEEKFNEEGLTEEEFDKLLYLKRLLKKDNMMKQEIKRLLLHNRILGQEAVVNFIIEGFEVGSLIDSPVDEVKLFQEIF